MSKLFVFLENNPAHLRINYQELHKHLPEESKLIVIAEQKPYDELISSAQREYCIGYLLPNFSLDGLKEKLQEIKLTHGEITEIVTNEEISVGYCGALKLAENLEPNENYDRFINKDLMKKKLSAAGMVTAIPKYFIFDKAIYLANPEEFLDNLEQIIPYPIFAKPTNLVGAIEAKKIANRAEFKAWAERAVTLGSHPIIGLPYVFEIDEYIEGELLHCDSLIKDGEIIHSFVGCNSVPCSEFTNQKPCGSVLLDEHHPDMGRIKQFIKDVHQGLGMPKSGVTHLEIFKKNDGKLLFLEIAYRPAGGGIPDLYKGQYHFDLRLAHILLQLLPDYRPVLTQQGPYTAYMDFPCQEGMVVDVIHPKIKSEQRFISHVEKNEVTAAASDIAHVAARIIFSNPDLNELLDDFNALGQYKPCVMSVPSPQFSAAVATQQEAVHAINAYPGAFWAQSATAASGEADSDLVHKQQFS